MRKLPTTCALLLVLLGAGCGAGDQRGGGLPGEAAAGLAVRAEGVAAALDAGRCDAALNEAKALQADLAAVDMAPEVRAEALAEAARLVNGIVCAPPPPPSTTTSVTAAPTRTVEHEAPRGKRGKGHKGDEDDD